MGLDQNIRRVPLVKCPCCYQKHLLYDPNEVGLDVSLKLGVEEQDVCYWRKNWDLHYFISNNLHHYGDEEYGKYIELSTEDLIAIKKYGENDETFGHDNYQEIKTAISESMTGDAVFFYEADW